MGRGGSMHIRDYMAAVKKQKEVFSFFTIQAPAGVMIWKHIQPGVLCNLRSSSSARCWVK